MGNIGSISGRRDDSTHAIRDIAGNGSAEELRPEESRTNGDGEECRPYTVADHMLLYKLLSRFLATIQ